MRYMMVVALVATSTAALGQPLVVNGTTTVDVDTSFDSVTVQSGGVLVLDARVTVAGDVIVENGGVITHTERDDDAVIQAGGLVEVQAGGSIDLIGKGYQGGSNGGGAFGARGETLDTVTLLPAAGPGVGNGGTHGGVGGVSRTDQALPPLPFGEQTAPVTLGGGGGGGSCNGAGGDGGGRIEINATTVRINGTLLANGRGGQAGCGALGGGGAGGSIYIQAASLEGSGSISANGGGGAAGGAGGRIAIHATDNFTGSLVALAGPSAEQGTAWLQVGNDLTARGGLIHLDGGDSFDSVTLESGGGLVLVGAPSVASPITVVPSTTLRTRAPEALDNLTVSDPIEGVLDVEADLVWPQSLTVEGALQLNAALTVQGDLLLASASTTNHDVLDEDAELDVTGAFTLEVGAFLDLNARGYRSRTFFDPFTLQVSATQPSFAGGGHGADSAGGGNAAYGDPRDPGFLGAGGGLGSCNGRGGHGGGAIAIRAADIRVDGILSADGDDGVAGCGARGGGGAGGSVLLDASGAFSGAGLITADGGLGEFGGSGGRVAVFYDSSTYSGLIRADAGDGAHAQRHGIDGTVYIESGATLVGQGGILPIDGGDVLDSVTLLPGATLAVNGAAQVAQSVVVAPGATVELNSSASLDNLSLAPDIAGTLRVNAPVTTAALNVDGVLVLNDHLTVAGDLTLNVGANVTHDLRVEGARLEVTGVLNARPGSTINLNGKGYRGANRFFADRGESLDPVTLEVVPGSGDRNGGSHGGRGAVRSGAPLNPVYGDSSAPVTLGAGGGEGSCNGLGGFGGGALRIDASRFTLDGQATANGTIGTAGCGERGGGGAGGSFFIEAGTFEGSGVLRANGADGGGGGGGGRIRVHAQGLLFDGVVTTSGGGGNATGEDGTVELFQPTDTTLVVEGGLFVLDEDDLFEEVILGPGGILDIQGPAAVATPIVIAAGSTVILSSPDWGEILSLAPDVDGRLVIDTDTIVPEALDLRGRLTVNRQLLLPALTARAGSLIDHDTKVFTMDLIVAGTFDLQSGAFVDVTAKGYGGANNGSPFGNNGETFSETLQQVASGSAAGAGGSHAVRGGGNSAAAFDDPLAPIHGGGGGGEGSCNGRGGRGGGLLRISAGTLIHNGLIHADGSQGTAGCGAIGGGGAGGAVVLRLGDWTGIGPLTANGAFGTNGGGAGGILVLEYADRTHTGNVEARGGGGSSVGEDGSTSEAVVQTPPTIISAPPATATAGQPFSYLAFAQGTPPITWLLVEGPPGAAIDPDSGLFTATPDSSTNLTATIRATNPFGFTEQSLDIATLVPPEITSIPGTSAVLNLPYSYDADGAVEAVGGTPMTFSLLLAPDGMTIDPDSGVIAWTPSVVGGFGVCVVARNAVGEDLQCFTVVVGDEQAPAFISAPEILLSFGEPYRYDDDDTLEAVGTGPITFAAVEVPEGFVVDPGGLITWTPAAPGNYDVTVSASNALGTAQQAWTVTVLPVADGSPPVIIRAANGKAAVGRPYIYDDDLSADAGGDAPISWNTLSAPDGFVIDAATGFISWFPDAPGDFEISLVAVNALGSDSYTFTVNVVEQAPPPPTAVAVIDPIEGDAPLTISADASQSYAAPTASLSFFSWSFGDSTPQRSGAQTEHTYTRPGSYVAGLRVVDSFGAIANTSVVVSVLQDGQRPPSARLLVSRVDGADQLEVSFSCDCEAGDAPIAGFLWDFGDGATADGNAVTHTFGPGGHTVRLTVVDEAGLTATDSVVIRVSDGDNLPPLVNTAVTPPAGVAPLSTTLVGTFGDPDGEVAEVRWDLGDGTVIEDDAVVTHTFTDPGVYLVALTVTDALGLASTSTLEVQVTDAANLIPPLIISVPSAIAEAGEAYAYDADDTPAARGDRPLRWSLGKLVGGETVGAPAGMTVDVDTGLLSWTPAPEQIGAELVVLVAENDAGVHVQEWEVAVDGERVQVEEPPEDCACDASGEGGGPASAGAFALLGLALLLRRRRD